MRFTLIVITFLLSNTVFADQVIKTKVHGIDMGKSDEVTLIFLTTGQVVSLPKEKEVFLSSLRLAKNKNFWVQITLNRSREIVHFNIESSSVDEVSNLKLLPRTDSYIPSILKNLLHARIYFQEARTDAKKESQCFNRAHVWAYEWRTKHNIYSSKVWIFFTRRYIRKYKFEWWFHVAPSIHIIDEGEVRERLMDIKYAQGPLKLKQWTDIFMRDGSHCPVVEKYSDHANYPQSGSCFIMKSSMYYYQPADLEKLEITGEAKNKWIGTEVQQAYTEAFDVIL